MFLVLTRWDCQGTGVYVWLDGKAIPWANDLIGQTFIGSMKDGKIVRALAERSGLVAEMIVRALPALFFIILLPVIHPPTRQRWLGRIQARFA